MFYGIYLSMRILISAKLNSFIINNRISAGTGVKVGYCIQQLDWPQTAIPYRAQGR